MAFQTNFIAGSEVTISGNVNSVPAEKSVTNVYKSISTSEQTIYTVPANKVAYIVGMTLSTNTCEAYIKVNGTIAFMVAVSSSSMAISMPYKQCLKITAGQIIQTKCNTNSAYANVFYIEEDA